MPWWLFALLGAIGGAIVEALEVFRWIAVWQEARRNPSGRRKQAPPKWRTYVDVPAHAVMLPARAALGAGAVTLFGITGQVTGVYGAVAFGCAAPVLLAQLGLIARVEKTVNDAVGPQKPQADQAVAMTAAAAGGQDPVPVVEGGLSA